MPQSLTDVNIHFAFSTKHRQQWLAETWSDRLHEYLGGIIRERNCKLIKAGGMPDHVHLLIGMARTISMADLMRDVKSASSKWIHNHFPELACFEWQSGYGGFSVSHSQMPVIEEYIHNQKEHHRVRSFQEEFRALLEKHKLEWDERYVWD